MPDCQALQILSLRLMCWAVFLNAYNYHLLHRPGKALGHANALSCLELPDKPEDLPANLGVLLLDALPQPPISVTDVASHTIKDRVL